MKVKKTTITIPIDLYLQVQILRGRLLIETGKLVSYSGVVCKYLKLGLEVSNDKARTTDKNCE